MQAKKNDLETGEAMLTNGYNLPVKQIIHTVGPIIDSEVTKENESELANCYCNSLQLAIENGIKTIAFPCIATGEFRFPKKLACKIAIQTIDGFLSKYPGKIEKVVLNVYGEEDKKIYEEQIRKNRTN